VTSMLPLLERALLLCLSCVLPPLLGAALCGGLVDFLQGRLGVSEPAPAALARILGGLLALLLFAPWLGGEVLRFAAALWTTLPALQATALAPGG
jgi:type III secretory pathway component EscS